MRVLLDTNVLISYLLSSRADNTVVKIVQAATDEQYSLLLPAPVIEELEEKIRYKRYLAERISVDELNALVEFLGGLSIPLPVLNQTIPAISRDPEDDFLLLYAVTYRADYLVTGDGDLLTLDQVAETRIRTPTDFLQILDTL